MPARAAFQPPAYQAQSMPAAERLSPMVGIVWLGTSWLAGVVAGCGELTEKTVPTTYPSGVSGPFSEAPESGFVSGTPASLSTALSESGALGKTAMEAEIKKIWFWIDPPYTL